MDIAKILDFDFLRRISFFNFENAITAAFYADKNLNLLNANKNFESLFGKGIETKSQNLLTLLANLGVEQKTITDFRTTLDKDGKVFFNKIYESQKKRIFNALKNSEPDSVVKFKEVLNKIINGKS